jgi:hypothetical protein
MVPADVFLAQIITPRSATGPIYFAMTTQAYEDLNLRPFLIRQGVALKLNNGPVEADPGRGIYEVPPSQLAGIIGPYIDVPRTEALLSEVFMHRGGFPDEWGHWVDSATDGIPAYYGYSHMGLAIVYETLGEVEARQRHMSIAERWLRLANQRYLPQGSADGVAHAGDGPPGPRWARRSSWAPRRCGRRSASSPSTSTQPASRRSSWPASARRRLRRRCAVCMRCCPRRPPRRPGWRRCRSSSLRRPRLRALHARLLRRAGADDRLHRRGAALHRAGFVLLMSAVLWRERVGRGAAVRAGAGAGGVVLVTGAASRAAARRRRRCRRRRCCSVSAAGATYALYTCSARSRRSGTAPGGAVLVVWLFATLALALLAPPHAPFLREPEHAPLLLGSASCRRCCRTHSTWLGLRELRASTAAMLASVEPVIATLLAPPCWANGSGAAGRRHVVAPHRGGGGAAGAGARSRRHPS